MAIASKEKAWEAWLNWYSDLTKKEKSLTSAIEKGKVVCDLNAVVPEQLLADPVLKAEKEAMVKGLKSKRRDIQKYGKKRLKYVASRTAKTENTDYSYRSMLHARKEAKEYKKFIRKTLGSTRSRSTGGGQDSFSICQGSCANLPTEYMRDRCFQICITKLEYNQ